MFVYDDQAIRDLERESVSETSAEVGNQNKSDNI